MWSVISSSLTGRNVPRPTCSVTNASFTPLAFSASSSSVVKCRPAVGAAAEELGLQVRCHATTRSPIGVCREPGYPIRNGVRLPSFYSGDRRTYLYDLAACDAALIVTDAPKAADSAALPQLAMALGRMGCPKLYLCGI